MPEFQFFSLLAQRKEPKERASNIHPKSPIVTAFSLKHAGQIKSLAKRNPIWPPHGLARNFATKLPYE